MLLTNCAACAAPLPTLAKQCGRCKTRYCGRACQEQHWKEGGHKDLCKRIKRGGGSERYHAEKKYKEAVAEAVEKCAEDKEIVRYLRRAREIYDEVVERALARLAIDLGVSKKEG